MVIVLSILIAFALDAWWDGAQSQAELRQDISNIRQEISDNQEQLAFQIDLLDRHVTGVEQLLTVMGATEDMSVYVSDTLAWLSTITPSFDPALGAIDALIAGGRLGAIENPELRRHLGGIRGRVEDAVEEQIESRRLFDNVIVPVLFTRLDIRRLGDVATTLMEERKPQTPLVSTEEVEFPNDLFIRNILDRRRFLYSVSLDELRVLMEQFDTVASMLEGS